MTDWDYGGAWRRHDMSGAIQLPNDSLVQACDLTVEMPGFMRDADTVFCDPPCSAGNLRSFHTKAGLGLGYTFDAFTDAFFGRVDEIRPRDLFVEVFASNRDRFLDEIRRRYHRLHVYDSHYYRRRSNRCWILHGTTAKAMREIDDIDEADAIAWICRRHAYDVIGDLCMGRGLVGRHAYLAGRRFVGTELNPKRLAVLVDFIAQHETKRATTQAGRIGRAGDGQCRAIRD